MGLLRQILIYIDVVIYSVVASVLQTIMDLANIELFQQSVIRDFANRIYIILGLVMLFKMMISFIQILVNPDKMDDKEQGMTNILKRVVIALALIVLVPSIFDLSRQLQNQVVPVIPKVILGVEADLSSDSGEASLNSIGREMAFYSFLAFFNYDNNNCDDGSIRGVGSQLSEGSSISPKINSVNDASAFVNDKTCTASTNANGYRYQYRMVLSTIVGLYLVWVLINVAVQIAIRTLKFAICEFIAPIPISSYIDPKTSKQAFDNWVSTSVKTYLDLFIHLALVYFMVFVFQIVLTNDFLLGLYGNLGGDWWRVGMVTLFIILGLLQFVKQAPKFISDMLGLKGAGDYMGIFKGAAGMASATVGAGLAGIGNIINARRSGAGIGKTIGSGLAGMTSGMWHGNKAALSGKSVKETFTSSTQTPWKRRNYRASNKASGSTIGGRLAVAAKDYFQFTDDVSLAEGILKSLSTVRGDISSSKKASFSVLDKNASKVGFRSDSKVKKAIDDLILKNADNITKSGNETLKRYLKYDSNGKVVGLNTGQLSYADLSTLVSAGQSAGIGDFEYFRLDKEYGLAAQKELHQDLISGKAVTYTSTKEERDKIVNHNDIVTARDNAHANITKNAGDLYGMVYNGQKLTTIEQIIEAYDKDQSGFDDALQARIQEVNKSITENNDAINRAANQRMKQK